MFWKKEKIKIDDVIKNWPEKYYEIDNKKIKFEALNIKLKNDPENKEYLRMLEIFNLRYTTKGMVEDNFYFAWNMLKACSKISINFLNRQKTQNDVLKYLQLLGILNFKQDKILEREWYYFAKSLFKVCSNSKSYKTSLLGLIQISDRNVAYRVGNDIGVVAYKVPKLFCLNKECEKFRKIIEKCFIENVEDGEKILISTGINY